MTFIDSHTHSYLRGAEDLEAMALAGIEAAVVCAYLPVAPSSGATLVDLFRWLDEAERARLSEAGIAMRLAVGVHPRSIPEAGLDVALARVEELLRSGAAVALGEVGLETGSPREREVFAEQLRLAKRLGVPAVIHISRKEKPQRLAETVELIEREGFDPSRAVLDHLTPDLMEVADRVGAWAGITVQPGKVSAAQLSALVRARGPERLLVDSDLSPAPSDPLAVARVARQMLRDGHSAEVVDRVTRAHAAALFAPARHG